MSLKKLVLVLLFSCALLTLHAQQVAHDDPVADPKAVVTVGEARFTVLTPQLIRMEWSRTKQFEDHASMVFINRRLPVPKFVKGIQFYGKVQVHTIITDKLTLSYHEGSGKFTPENLSITFQLNGKAVTWRPGVKDEGNLGGTLRTLDGVKGSAPLGEGLISRDGWVVVDDSERPLFDNSDWPWVMARPEGERQDWYFFGHGHDYKQALYDFTRVAGRIPMPPRFAFGTWWSRYWSYTDQEFQELVREFESHDVPLDVLVIDMDWHLTFGVKWWENKKDQSGHTLGWTGYTWNPDLFPDPPAFLRWVHQHGLKTTLNLHPASGVQPHEQQYPEMARAMGIDPASKKYVPFDIANKKFAENYMKILHYPLEKQGIDFFWLDWQQEDKTNLPGVNPTWWLNYAHFSDMERRGKRGLIFHRWGGLGNHRYQIGFSGDTISVWESLAFQPYFTATAANVGYGYWSHDIGGHMPGEVSPELYTRWIQWGVFSPILRTHTTKNPESERRIWAYPEPYAETMRDAFLLRYSLIPYIYSMSRKAYDYGLSICRPMYYEYPEAPEAYDYKNQYMFGDDMIVAPIAKPVNADSGLAVQDVWLPKGTWIEWFSGAVLKGPQKIARTFALDEIPVYVRSGAIIPMQPKMRHSGEKPVDPLILTVFPGANGETRVYEDEGDTLGYKSNAFTWTTVRQQRSADGTLRLDITPPIGGFSGALKQRRYEIRLVGEWPPRAVNVNGQALSRSSGMATSGWHFDGNAMTTIITLSEISTAQKLDLMVKLSIDQEQLLHDAPGRIRRLNQAMTVLNRTWTKGWSPDILVHAAQTGDRISYKPESAQRELSQLQADMPKIVEAIKAMDVDPKAIQQALMLLGAEGATAGKNGRTE